MARIVIVEDDADIADLLTRLMIKAGHTALAAASGPEALALIADQPPDLVIVDHHMPGMSGLELAEKLRSAEPTARVPLIMLSAAAPAAARGKVDRTISKPVRRDHLIEAVTELLSDTPDGAGGPALTDVPRLLAVADFLTEPGPVTAASLETFAAHLSALTGAEISAITLMLNDSVVLAAAHNPPSWLRESGGVPAEWSPDTIVVAEDVPVLISDSRNCPGYVDTPLFTYAGIRSYASVPLLSPEGHIVGTLCVMDHRPGTCTEATVQILHSEREAAIKLLPRARR